MADLLYLVLILIVGLQLINDQMVMSLCYLITDWLLSRGSVNVETDSRSAAVSYFLIREFISYGKRITAMVMRFVFINTTSICYLTLLLLVLNCCSTLLLCFHSAATKFNLLLRY